MVRFRKNYFSNKCSILASTVLSSAAQAEDTIKVGILHSLSGTMPFLKPL
ncbi:urea transport system substrate-binding protein [Pseudovibrio ascidiaceicola]|uniref:Urea transport system substrate-binding protein n=1 Tax=Pseudovibrio ascidiaceicola TaxID=285279 RepID=A0A1I4EAB7_9HYPH|nr:urea transport system substrate-binding protein [Pseudovibrio ascidiaceicola]